MSRPNQNSPLISSTGVSRRMDNGLQVLKHKNSTELAKEILNEYGHGDANSLVNRYKKEVKPKMYIEWTNVIRELIRLMKED